MIQSTSSASFQGLPQPQTILTAEFSGGKPVYPQKRCGVFRTLVRRVYWLDDRGSGGLFRCTVLVNLIRYVDLIIACRSAPEEEEVRRSEEEKATSKESYTFTTTKSEQTES